jgi:hypothetical protein
MKKITSSLILILNILFLGNLCKAQDYNDLGRTKTEEINILKYNGYKITRIQSVNDGQEVYLAKKANQNQFENVITIDKASETVVGLIWNFENKNRDLIKSMLTDMIPTDNSFTRLENKNGIALMTIDPEKEGHALVIWKKKA